MNAVLKQTEKAQKGETTMGASRKSVVLLVAKLTVRSRPTPLVGECRSTPPLSSDGGIAAIDYQLGAGDERGFVAGQEHHAPADLFRLSSAFHRGHIY